MKDGRRNVYALERGKPCQRAVEGGFVGAGRENGTLAKESSVKFTSSGRLEASGQLLAQGAVLLVAEMEVQASATLKTLDAPVALIGDPF